MAPVTAILATWALYLSTAVSSAALEDRQLPDLPDLPDLTTGSAISSYAPTAVSCPSESLLRNGRSISAEEKAWANKRYTKATASLKKFIAGAGNFPTLKEYPMLALANGGGGIRGFLTSAGTRLAYDSREGNNYSTSGLLQAMTYESGLSGSSIMLGSYAENNNDLTMNLYENLWKEGISNGLFMPDGPLGSPGAYAGIVTDMLAKRAAGADISLSDTLGRLFGYVMFPNTAAGPAGEGNIYSNILSQSAYKNHEAPLPILTSLGVETVAAACGLAPQNATQYEFTPFEFGSFNDGVKSFTQTKYLGSSLSNGKATGDTSCYTGFDNTNFVVGTSTAIFNSFCGKFFFDPANSILSKAQLSQLETIVDTIGGIASQPLVSFIPNYAYKSAASPKVESLETLMLVDGGENIQVIPDWPMIFRKDIKVLFMTDSSAYGEGKTRVNLPNGRSLTNSYKQAIKEGVGNRFPVIPGPEVFLKKGLTKRATFFGCNLKPNDPAFTIVYLPNKDYTYNSAVKTNTNKFTPTESLGLLLNGAQVGTNGNDPKFGFCSTCVIMKRQAEAEGKKLPSGCAKCFKEYCYN